MVGPNGLDELLARLEEDGRIVHIERFASRSARFGTLDRPLPDDVIEALPFDQFFTHQAQAINHLRDGQSVAVATGTASGKSLCYQVPIAEAAAKIGPHRCCCSRPRRWRKISFGPLARWVLTRSSPQRTTVTPHTSNAHGSVTAATQS